MFDVIQWFAEQNITIPRPHKDWRLCDRQLGQIVGIPSSRGILAATNGIECFIERCDGGAPFRGHLSWWQKDKSAASNARHGVNRANRDEEKENVVLREYIF